jgi:hypothetical protein
MARQQILQEQRIPQQAKGRLSQYRMDSMPLGAEVFTALGTDLTHLEMPSHVVLVGVATHVYRLQIQLSTAPLADARHTQERQHGAVQQFVLAHLVYT